jgi:hypothetical protein
MVAEVAVPSVADVLVLVVVPVIGAPPGKAIIPRQRGMAAWVPVLVLVLVMLIGVPENRPRKLGGVVVLDDVVAPVWPEAEPPKKPGIPEAESVVPEVAIPWKPPGKLGGVVVLDDVVAPVWPEAEPPKKPGIPEAESVVPEVAIPWKLPGKLGGVVVEESPVWAPVKLAGKLVGGLVLAVRVVP